MSDIMREPQELQRLEQAERLKKLILWTYRPNTDPQELMLVLTALTEADLLVALTMENSAARLAWLEWGRRRKLFDLRLVLQKIDGGLQEQVEIQATAPAMPVQEVPSCVFQLPPEPPVGEKS